MCWPRHRARSPARSSRCSRPPSWAPATRCRPRWPRCWAPRPSCRRPSARPCSSSTRAWTRASAPAWVASCPIASSGRCRPARTRKATRRSKRRWATTRRKSEARAVSTNEQLFERAQKVIPGGVNSPVRAFRAVGGTPRFIARGEGAWIVDAEGKRYVDYIGSWGPMILGHGPPAGLAGRRRAARDGFSFGAPTEREVELAEEIIRHVPSVEQVRLVSSGTEAAMSAIRLARAATGRARLIKFEGCYHGHADALLVKAGSGLAAVGHPTSARA